MSDTTTIRPRDENGRFIATSDGEIIDADVVVDDGASPGTELAVIPEPSVLPDILIAEALSSVITDRSNADPRIQRAVAVAEKLFPEMAAETSQEREFVFDPELIKARTLARLGVAPWPLPGWVPSDDVTVTR